MAVSKTLITGASAGIGYELARQFAAGGSDLVLAARRLDKLDALAKELRGKYGIKIETVEVDLSVRDARQKLFERFSGPDNTIDALVNNAGFGLLGKVVELGVQPQLDMIEVNIAALMHLTRLFLPGIIQRGRGGILNVGSTAAFQGGPGLAVYYASKAFVLSFSEGLVEELAGTGVRVTCLCPGPTVTEFAEKAGLEESMLMKFRPMTAAQVAEAGYQAFRKGKFLVIPGALNYLGTVGAHIGPRWLTRKIAGWLNSAGG